MELRKIKGRSEHRELSDCIDEAETYFKEEVNHTKNNPLKKIYAKAFLHRVTGFKTKDEKEVLKYLSSL